jgi:hypothetical protein
VEMKILSLDFPDRFPRKLLHLCNFLAFVCLLLTIWILHIGNFENNFYSVIKAYS